MTRCEWRWPGMIRTSAAQQAARSRARADWRSSADVPAGHQTVTRSPNGSDVVRTTSGSLPRPDRMCACVNPDRSRCGVTMRHAAAICVSCHGGPNVPSRADTVMTVQAPPSTSSRAVTAMAAPASRASS
ncbi:MAG TPA: hypothetical protein VLW44_18900 [Streptosporangiaceae bacterium]|nr:hypothetical protein [Streptosporangiaceae bacterium]